MAYQPSRDLYLKHSSREFWHFALYIEPGVVTAAHNGAKIIEEPISSYSAEWLHSLERCEPDALHVALVGNKDAQKLWHRCVYEDPESPAAVGDGCVCWQTFRDPLTQLPVAAQHFRTVSGNIETWRHYTFTPLELPDNERLDRLIIDRVSGVFWVRSNSGAMYLLPEERGAGYEVGYGGGGPGEFARLIVKIVKSDGRDLSAGTAREHHNELVDSWACSKMADHTQELTMEQLKVLCRTGTVPERS